MTTASRPMQTCPVCRAQVAARNRAESPCHPFCSPRCRLIDLGRWLGGDYRLAGSRIDPADASNPEQSLPERPN